MNLTKKAQFQDLDGISVSNPEELDEVLFAADEEVDNLFLKEKKDEDTDAEIEILLQEGDEEPERFEFKLPAIPGADDQTELLVDPSDLEVEEEEEVEVEQDPWKWTLETFVDWLQAKLANIPRHSGKDRSGIERAISYLKFLDGEASKATKQDIKGLLDCNAVEDYRDQMYDGIKRLEERLEQISQFKYNKGKKKKADEDTNLVKEASKASSFVVSVPLFISHIARVCINSMVSGGHDIERTFKKLAEKYELDKREQAEVTQLLSDMGYSVFRDRGFTLDEEIDPRSSDNFDWAAQFSA